MRFRHPVCSWLSDFFDPALSYLLHRLITDWSAVRVWVNGKRTLLSTPTYPVELVLPGLGMVLWRRRHRSASTRISLSE